MSNLISSVDMLLLKPMPTYGKPQMCGTCYNVDDIVETDENERLENQCVYKCTCCGQRYYEKRNPHVPDSDVLHLEAESWTGWGDLIFHINVAYNIWTEERIVRLHTGKDEWKYVDIQDEIIRRAFTPNLISGYLQHKDYPECRVFDSGGLGIRVSNGKVENCFSILGHYDCSDLKYLFELLYSDEWYEVPPPLDW